MKLINYAIKKRQLFGVFFCKFSNGATYQLEKF